MNKSTIKSDFYFFNFAGKVSQNDCKHSERSILQNIYLFPSADH